MQEERKTGRHWWNISLFLRYFLLGIFVRKKNNIHISLIPLSYSILDKSTIWLTPSPVPSSHISLFCKATNDKMDKCSKNLLFPSLSFFSIRITIIADKWDNSAERKRRTILPIDAESTKQCRIDNCKYQRQHTSASVNRRLSRCTDPSTKLPSTLPLRTTSWTSTQVTVHALRSTSSTSSTSQRAATDQCGTTVASIVEKFIKFTSAKHSNDTKSQDQLIHWAQLNARAFIALIVRGFWRRADRCCKVSLCANPPTDTLRNHHDDLDTRLDRQRELTNARNSN